MVRLRLAELRRRGFDFERAWLKARSQRWDYLFDAEDRRDWLIALDSLRGAWERAYNREPDPAVEAVAALLGEVERIDRGSR